MADISIKTAGNWQTVKRVNVKSGGSWREIKAAWVKTGGAWRQVFANVFPKWTAGVSVWDSTSPYNARILIQTGGTISLLPNGSAGVWLPSGESAANYEVKWDRTAGSTLNGNGMAENVFYPLTADREVSLTSAGSLQASDADITIRHIPSGKLLVVSLHLEAGPGADAS